MAVLSHGLALYFISYIDNENLHMNILSKVPLQVELH